MKKKFILLLLLAVLFIPIKAKALSSSDFNNQTFSDDLSTILNRYFKVDDFLYFKNNNNAFYVLPVSSNQHYCLKNNTTAYTIYYINEANSQYSIRLFSTNFTNINIVASDTYTPALSEVFGTHNSTNITGGTLTNLNSTFDLPDCDNLSTTLFTANKTYTPPTVEEGECGPVEVSNFPISKTDFYVLLIIIASFFMFYFIIKVFSIRRDKER